MSKCIRRAGSTVALGVIAVLIAAPAQAQSPAGCKVTTLADPPREVLRCGSGLKVEAEQGAHAGQIGELQARSEADRDAFVGRIRELEETLAREIRIGQFAGYALVRMRPLVKIGPSQ